MSQITQEIINMVDMLPENEQNLAYELIKRLVLAWDPDYTKVTIAERESIKRAELEIENGEYFSDDEIGWDNLEKIE